ncbi:hypothetical protein [Actinomadura decatromicini]|uniref:Uncharacterized protein n=1 Tax=Actinomadura decatromicini TaxID=2604572 RepID=A0A5D3FJ37_9ACTN|nr:hypothetical protein [Actinomadura decatromicini]TYK47916.1 hypothetical protein FXF68_19675 [Actinomadura decatromicini]
MADNWVETIAGDLRRWADERDEALDEQGTRILLELVRDEMGLPGPEALTPEHLRELLLGVFPESVVAGREDVPTVLEALRRIVAYLDDTGAVTAEDAAALKAELDRTGPEFADLVAEVDSEERQAAAEVIGGLMQADGVSLDDQDAVDAWVREFEALPEEERYARTEGYLRQAEELVVPPVRLAPVADLAEAVRHSRLTENVLALAEWTGERALTEHDTLTESDADAAAVAVGLRTPRRHGGLEDAGELERLWWAAVEAKVIAAEQGRAAPGPSLDGLRSGDDSTLLAAWLPLFEALVVPGHDYADGLDAVELVQNEMTGVLIHLYEQEDPTAPETLVDALLEHVDEAYDLGDSEAMTALVTDAFHLELATLGEWGVVEEAGEGRALTPLGVWAVRELLLADGFTAPVIGELAKARASDLIAGLTWYRPDAADEEIDGWLSRHDPKDAAADLLDVMRTGGPGARNLAAAVLHRIGPEAAPVVRSAQEHPLVSPYAALWLNATGDPSGRELAREEYLWVFVDTVAGMLETAEPDEAVEAALADAPPGAEMEEMVDELWRTDHPGVADVLEALGAHHPDRATAKAARTAAYKARSAHQTARRGV